jgi:hypothetical protein
MGMWLDASRDDDLAAGVDDPPDVARERAWRRYGDDLLSLNGYIPVTHPPGGHHLITSNQIIKHRTSLRIKLSSTGSYLPWPGYASGLASDGSPLPWKRVRGGP